MKKTKKKKKRRKRRRRRNTRSLSLVARAFLRTLCTTKLGGLGFLRTARESHNSGTPCRTACHTFRTALKSPVGASADLARTCSSRRRGTDRDYAAEPAAPGDLSKLCRRERLS